MQRQDGNTGLGINKQGLARWPKPSRLLSSFLPTLLQARVISGEMVFVWKVLYASRKRRSSDQWNLPIIEFGCPEGTNNFVASAFTFLIRYVLCKSFDNKPPRNRYKNRGAYNV